MSDVGRPAVVPEAQLLALLRLGVGRPAALTVEDWPALAAFARQERGAALAWSRSREFISANAPASVVAEWRASALFAHARALAQAASAARLLQAMRQAGVPAMVLKGCALSVQAYGDPGIRLHGDIDLSVAPEYRARAHDVLVEAGFVPEPGGRPTHQAYVRRAEPPTTLELHSSLLDADYGIDVPMPSAATVTIDGIELTTSAPPYSLLTLACDMIADERISVSGDLDLWHLWNRLRPEEREEAVRIARDARLAGFLRFAIARVRRVDAALEGDRAALRALCTRAVDSPTFQMLRATESWSFMVALAVDWVRPNPGEQGPVAWMRLYSRRARRLFRRVFALS